MELAPRVMMLRNVGSVKIQSSFLDFECTCGGESAKRRVMGPIDVRGPFPREEEQRMEKRQTVIKGWGFCGDS